jgi:hypothetical protein
MVQVTRALVILSIAALGLAAVLKRDAATVEADLAVLTSQVTALDSAVQAFPLTGGTLAEAMVVHTNAVNVISTLNTAASDEQAAGAFSEADGQAICPLSRVLSPPSSISCRASSSRSQHSYVLCYALALYSYVRYLQEMLSGVTAQILQDLENYLSAGIAFGSTLFNNVPVCSFPIFFRIVRAQFNIQADLDARVAQFRNNIISAFAVAINAYSS